MQSNHSYTPRSPCEDVHREGSVQSNHPQLVMSLLTSGFTPHKYLESYPCQGLLYEYIIVLSRQCESTVKSGCY